MNQNKLYEVQVTNRPYLLVNKKAPIMIAQNNNKLNIWKDKLNYFARRRETSNCTMLTASPPIYAIGEKKPEKIQGLNGNRTRDLRE